MEHQKKKTFFLFGYELQQFVYVHKYQNSIEICSENWMLCDWINKHQ